jgi:long-subunit fatty acid transport protein
VADQHLHAGVDRNNYYEETKEGIKMKNIIMTTVFTLLIMQLSFAQTAEDAMNLISNESGFGIRATSMGNAYSAVSDDYSAVYYNPAGLAMLKETEFSGSLYNLNNTNEADYLGNTTITKGNYTKLQSIGFAYPFPVIQGAFTVAFGYQHIQDLDKNMEFSGYNTNSNGLSFDFGQDELIPFDKDIYQKQTVVSEGFMDQWSIAAAIDLSRNLSGGISINFVGGKEDYTSNYYQEDVNNNYEGFPSDLFSYSNRQVINSKFNGIEYKIGGLMRFTNFINLGASVTFPYGLTVEENWSEDDNLTYDDGTDDPADLGSGYFDYIIKQPYKFNIGASIHSPALVLSASATYIDWRQTRYEVPDDADPYDYQDLLEQNEFFQNEYRAVLSYAGGVELKLFPDGKIILRAGYRYLPTPMTNVGTEYDKTFYSAGAALRIDENATFEVGAVRGTWKTEMAYGYTDYATQNIISDKYMAGLTLRF